MKNKIKADEKVISLIITTPLADLIETQFGFFYIE